MTEHAENAVRRPYTLSDWTFVLGLPTTPAEFINAKAYGQFCLLPPPLLTFRDYQTAFLDAFDRHISTLARIGLRIVRYPTARQYAALLRDTNATVLFTHSDGASLEFRDGMIPFAQVVHPIRSDFAGIAEVCACAPEGLQDLIKDRAPASLVKVSGLPLSSGIWMAYYGYFLASFVPAPSSFGEACLRADAMLKRISGTRAAGRAGQA